LGDDIADEEDIRSAREAALARERRKSRGLALVPEEQPLSLHKASGTNTLSSAQLNDVYTNCIKLSTENKINQKNSWQLPLIDHIEKFLKNSGGAQTNFQVASCTLDASVKIYSYRVDSVHSEAFRILGGLSFAKLASGDEAETHGNASDEGHEAEAGDVSDEDGPTQSKAVRHIHVSGESTLEPSVDALNMKKMDLDFQVDPLFRKTSATFDEGGAKGLLLNSLHVGTVDGDICRLIFDSSDVHSIQPDDNLDPNGGDGGAFACHIVDLESQISALSLDFSSMKICPAFDQFRESFDAAFLLGSDEKGDLAAEPSFGAPHEVPESDDDDNDNDDDGDAGHGNGTAQHETEPQGPPPPEDHRRISSVEPGSTVWEPDNDVTFLPSLQSTEQYTFSTAYAPEDNSVCLRQDIASLDMFWSSGMWAGPDHWKFKPRTQCDGSIEQEGTSTELGTKRSKRAKKEPISIDFSSPDKTADPSLLHSLNPRHALQTESILRKADPRQTTLPEDLHISFDDLSSLFLRTDLELRRVLAKGLAALEGTDDASCLFAAKTDPISMLLYDSHDFGGEDHDDDRGDDLPNYQEHPFDGGDTAGDTGLAKVPLPKRVGKIDIGYARIANRVDVGALKETIWNKLSSCRNEVPEQAHSGPAKEQAFSSLVSHVSSMKQHQPKALQDVSVSFCFICLLHLANEKELTLQGQEDLKDLRITL